MPEMKNSGVDWIGEIPADWNVIPIRYLFREIKDKNKNCQEKTALKFTYGTIIPKNNFDADEDDYVANTISTYTVVHPGVIMINCLNLNYDFISQRIGLVKDKGVITSAYLAIEPNEKIAPRFANYQLKCWDAVKAFHNMGSGVRKTLDFSELGKKYFLSPPLEVQKSIANFLDKKCSEINSLSADIQSQIDILEEYKKSVITEAVTKGLNPDVEMKDSGIEWIGIIPEHYETKPLKYLVDYNANSLPENTTPDYEFDYIDIGSVTYGKGIEQFQRMCFKDAPSRARRIVHKNDVILSTVRTYLKATAEIPENELPIIVSTGFITLTANALINPQYLKYIVQLDAFVSEVESRSTGVSYPAINASEVVKIKVILPPLNEQREVANYLNNKCSEIDAVIADKKEQLETLAEYKKSLIYEYVTGKKGG